MHAVTSAKNQEARLSALQTEIEGLQHTLGEHEDAEKIVKNHITLLHQYNEAKDATQVLIGRLATLKEMTIRQIHEELGLDTTD